MPEWFDKWETTGLLSFTDKNEDGLIQYTADNKTNELTVDADIMVLANPEIAQLPNWVIALLAAGALAKRSPQQQAYCLSSHLQYPMTSSKKC